PQPNNNFIPQPSFNTNYLHHPMQNLEDVSNPINALDMALKLMAKAFQLTSPHQQTTTTEVHQTLATVRLHGCTIRMQFRIRVFRMLGIRMLSVISWIANQHGNGNVVASRVEDCSKKEVGIQLNSEEFDFMAAARAYNEIAEVNVNCTLNNNLQQASTSDSHQVQQNDNNVISEVFSVEQDGGTVEQHPATVEEPRAYFESLYNNLAIEVDKVNKVNRKLRETDSINLSSAALSNSINLCLAALSSLPAALNT
nr:hypothetical protein [Tanacetum cinerariifolium]